MYSPEWSVAEFRVSPVSNCVAVTAADGTAAPLGSSTDPRILPVICWAERPKGKAAAATTQQMVLHRLIVALDSYVTCARNSLQPQLRSRSKMPSAWPRRSKCLLSIVLRTPVRRIVSSEKLTEQRDGHNNGKRLRERQGLQNRTLRRPERAK